MRPWRLTRRQRVEMEAALADMRRESAYVGHAFRGAWLLGAGRDDVLFAPGPFARADRLLRARVAIALRAALRADEDARCEEAMRRVGGYDDGAEAALEAFCEWVSMSPLRRPWERVPLALWERT